MSKRILATSLVVVLVATIAPAQAAIDCGSNGTGTEITFNGETVTIQGGQINMAGAALFVDFFRQASSTNDWIDVNNNGMFGFNPNDPNFEFVDQLADGFTPGGNLNTWWAFNYRSVGSVNGFIEFVQYQLCGDVSEEPSSEAGLFNRFQYATGGATEWNGGWNPSGTPIQQCSIDGAFLDVPGSWAVQSDGNSPKWNLTPTAPAYGQNTIPTSIGVLPQLAQLTADCTTDGLNFNVDNPDADTVYNVEAAWVPVTPIANRGTALTDVKFSEMQYHFVTGRFPNGENFIACCRDVGSGTHNAWMNSIGVDPSWGRGDNVGQKTGDSATDLLGPRFQQSNRGGSSRMEGVVQNNRLSFGYTGVAGSSRSARDATRGFYEVLNVCKDVDQNGDPLCDCDVTGYVRPTLDAILDNCDACTGYQIAGSGSFTVRGNIDANRDPSDPNYTTNGPPLESQATADYLNNVLDSIAAFESDPLGGVCADSFTCTTSGLDCATHADCLAGEACDVPRSCSSIGDCESGDYCGEVVNSPGQGLAVSFFLPAAVDCLQDLLMPLNYGANGTLNADLQLYTRVNNGFGWGGGMPAYGSANVAGLVPRRLAQDGGATYLDGQVTSYVYYDGGTFQTIAGASDLSTRSLVQADFNVDGMRNLADATELVRAYVAPRSWQQTPVAFGTAAGADLGDMLADNAIPEILGDFDGDGNFTKEDLRYFADGLAMVATARAGRQLDRKQGAIAIDAALQAESFPFPWASTNGVIKQAVAAGTFVDPTFDAVPSMDGYLGATTNAYKLGDFRGDVAGDNPTAGAQPMGWDGKIDATDVDYVCRNIGDWTNLDEAVFMDMSCDMDGDLDVDTDDVTELVVAIIGTEIGDVNLDGVKDAADEAIAQATIDSGSCNGDASCGWADGDVNCDNVVDGDDLAIIAGAAPCAPADVNCDGSVTGLDIAVIKAPANWQLAVGSASEPRADVNDDGFVTGLDIAVVKAPANWQTSTGPCTCN